MAAIRTRWPPRKLQTDDLVFFGGFPGSLRERICETELLFKDNTLFQPVSELRDRYFYLDLSHGSWENPGRVEMAVTEQDVAGSSGSSVFAFDDPSYPLIGIVSDQPPNSIPVVHVRALDYLPIDLIDHLESFPAV